MTQQPSSTTSPAALRPQPTRAHRVLVGLLLLLHGALLIDGARRDSVTFDEVAFVAGGIAAWQAGDYRLSPDGGALPLRLAGLLPCLAGQRVALDSPAWLVSDAWRLGDELLRSAQDEGQLLLLARMPIALLAVGLAWLVHVIALRLFGPGAALIALTVHALAPAFLAHGRLATADLAFTATFLAATWLAARCLARPTLGSVATSCIATAVCVLAKFSALLLLPTIALVVLARLALGGPLVVGRSARRVESLGGRLGIVALLVVAHVTVSVACVWTAFGLRYSAFRHATGTEILKEGGWDGAKGAGMIEPALQFTREQRLLPEAFLFGLQFTARHSKERSAYALGQYSATGWSWFFPFAAAVKTPLATLVLLCLGVAAFPMAWARARSLTEPPASGDDTAPSARTPWRTDVLNLAPLLSLAGVYWAVALATPLNIGFRHVLPTIPVAFVIAGAAASLARGRTMRIALGALVLLAALEGLAAHPFHLAHMNSLGGLPEQRWRRLVDSSLDWGQDARRVAAWLVADARIHGGSSQNLAWFGMSDPAREGAPETMRRLDGRQGTQPPARLEEGTYVVSATTLAQVYGHFPGTWAKPYEDAWRRVDAIVERKLAGTATSAGAAEELPEPWPDLVARHQRLRLARLCAWLRHHPPDAVIGGGAVLAWHLDAASIEEALHGEPVELVLVPVME